jgi:DNA-binding CsgD family transcriptional regulator
MDTLPSYSLRDFELYPLGVLKTPFESGVEVTQLRLGGGIAEVMDMQDLTSAELRVGLLAAAGMSNPQIGELLGTLHGTRPSFGRDTFSDLMEKLDAGDRNQAISRLFERRILRVLYPAPIPGLAPDEMHLLQQNADGMTFANIAKEYGRTERWAQGRGTKLIGKMGSTSMTRAVLTGHLGEILPHGSSTTSMQATFDIPTTVSLSDMADRQLAGRTRFNYIRSPHGAFTIHKDTALSRDKQNALAYAAAGLNHAQVAAFVGKSPNVVNDQFGDLYDAIGAKNKPHAITQGLVQNNLMIVRHKHRIGLSNAERSSLSLAALGLRSHQSSRILDRSEGGIRQFNSEIIQKLGEQTITGAVMAGYLRREIELDEVLDLGRELETEFKGIYAA